MAAAMPHYPLDHRFIADLPEELRPHFQGWQGLRTDSGEAAW
ncbi:hypothetical protein [Novosphingobium sp.]|nr:hypothetical protein [Novosphingobium sp.]